MFLSTPPSCIVATTHLFSQSLSIVLQFGNLLLNVILRFSISRCIRWPGFALIRLSCHGVIDVMLQHCVCCTRLFRTRIIVYSVNIHLLLSEFDILELRQQVAHPLEFEVQFRCSLITQCQKVFFLNELKLRKLFQFLNLVTQILL